MGIEVRGLPAKRSRGSTASTAGFAGTRDCEKHLTHGVRRVVHPAILPSASCATEARPEFQKMLKYCPKCREFRVCGKTNVVTAGRIDRRLPGRTPPQRCHDLEYRLPISRV